MSEYISSWNPAPSPHLADVEIEDDSIRDGLQGAFARKPSTEEKLELMRLSAAVGSQAILTSFPAASAQELADGRRMVRAIDEEKLGIVPRCLARALPGDVAPIVDINRDADCDVWGDFFVGTSPIRRYVEGWAFDDILRRIESTAKVLVAGNTHFGISIEDATRTPAEDLKRVIEVAVESGAEIILLCDTVGESTPEGARRIVEFTRSVLPGGGMHRVWWHGHNDRGLANANSIAAAEAGVDAVSGAFGGMGERSGNSPLEQLLLYLWQGGNRRFHLDRIVAYCQALSRFGDSPPSEHLPLIGKQAFSTAVGTHAAAVLKARAIGADFEDLIFSAVPASILGRKQDIIIGPLSGLKIAHHVLEQLELDASEASAERLLAYAKSNDRWLGPDHIRSFFRGER